MTAGTRYRMVHVVNGEEHVNSVILGEAEVAEHLEWEREFHEKAGWSVTWAHEHSMKFPQLVCLRFRNGKPSVRRIFARKSSPLQDSVAVRVTEPPLPPRTAHTGEDA